MPVLLSADPSRLRPSTDKTAPHVGHLSTMVLADIIKRWQLLQGRTAMLSTGTDEHGLKVGPSLQPRCLQLLTLPCPDPAGLGKSR